MFTEQIFALEGFAFAVNYGLNKVRFPAPLPVGSRVRMHAKLKSLEDVPGGAQIDGRVHVRARGRRQAGLRRRDARAGLRAASAGVSAIADGGARVAR